MGKRIVGVSALERQQNPEDRWEQEALKEARSGFVRVNL
jgi:hypothetical protein